MNKIIVLILIAVFSVPARAATTTIRPANNVSVTFTPSSGSDNAAMLSETTHDDDTTYNTRSDGTGNDKFTGADVCFDAGTTISAVVLTCWAGRPAVAGTATAALQVIHDATYTGVTFTVPVGTYSQFDFDVSASEAWDLNDFNGGGKIQFGYKEISLTREKRFTQCFLTVTYTGTIAACAGGSSAVVPQRRVIVAQ